MATITFDMHKFIKTLQDAGFEQKQAEAVSAAATLDKNLCTSERSLIPLIPYATRSGYQLKPMPAVTCTLDTSLFDKVEFGTPGTSSISEAFRLQAMAGAGATSGTPETSQNDETERVRCFYERRDRNPT